MSTNLHLPGRLGNPDATIETDGRCDPRLVSVTMQGYAPDVAVPPADASYEDCLAYCAGLEGTMDETHPLQLAAMPNFDHVDQSTETIQGPDDNDITLYIHRPKGVDRPLPSLVHLHGGGMVILTAADPTVSVGGTRSPTRASSWWGWSSGTVAASWARIRFPPG